MKTWLSYYHEQEGLAALGQQDLADDHEKPEDEQQPNTPPGGDDSFPTQEDEQSLVRKAMRIALKAGDQYRKRIHSFLHRLARDIPELQNLVSQLKDDDDEHSDEEGPPSSSDRNMVSTPSADIPPGQDAE
jgi:hypothetical protein